MRFFLDNNLAPRHARALDALLAPDHSVVHLRDKFAANVDDVVWLEALAQEGDWVVISGDVRINTVPHLREAWPRAKLTIFFLKPGWMKLPLLDQHSRLSKHMDAIIKAAGSHTRGTRFSVGVQGKIERLAR